MSWTKTQTVLVGSVIVLAAGVLTIAIHRSEPKHVESSEDAIRQFSETPNGALSVEAAKFLLSLKLKGQLPGIASNAPAGIEIPWFSHRTNDGTWHLTNTNVEGYPISLTLTVHANDVNCRYHYTITKASETNRWQLRKAWCADTNGTILKKFPVPSNQDSSK